MAKIFTNFRNLIGIFVFAAVFSISAVTNASTYGSNNYNQCNYNGVGCSASSSSSSSTTTTTDTSTGDVINLDPFSTFTDGTGKSTPVTESTVFEFSLFVDQTNNSSQDTAGSNTATEKHTITIDKITADSVVITVASTPKQYTLKLLTPLLLDLTGDGKNDVGIEATTITPPTATLKVWKITATTATPVAAGTATPAKTTSWTTYALIAIGIAALLVLPRKFFIRVIALFSRKNDNDHKDHPSAPINIFPAHDFHSQAGDVINEFEEVDNKDKK